jgi:hypothetical protein
MPEPDAFALMITSTMVSFGVVSAFAQLGIILTLYGKYGFVLHNTGTGLHEFRYLSDTFALDPGLTNTWLMTMIPSVAVAAIILHTAIQRRKDSTSWSNTRIQVTALWLVVYVTQMGLIMLVLYNITWRVNEHYIGVVLTVTGGLILNIWVILFDYEVTRRRWHPHVTFDTCVLLITFCAVILFVQPGKNASVLGEWLLLIIVWVCHTLMPFRGARIVLSPPNDWKVVISNL